MAVCWPNLACQPFILGPRSVSKYIETYGEMARINRPGAIFAQSGPGSPDLQWNQGPLLFNKGLICALNELDAE